MDLPNSPATIALFQASIEAESVREKTAQLNSWQASVEEMILIPEAGEAPTELPTETFPSVGVSRTKLDRTKKSDNLGNEQSYNNHRNPIKIVPPPKAITVNSAPLKD